MAGTPTFEYPGLLNSIYIHIVTMVTNHSSHSLSPDQRCAHEPITPTVNVATATIIITLSILIGSPNWLPGPMKYAYSIIIIMVLS